MATAKYAKIMMESGQTAFAYTEATDSGDQKVYTVSGKTVFSNKSGYEVSVRPDGIVTGRNLLTPSATADKVSVAGFTCYQAGALVTVTAADSPVITRPASAVSKVCSIVIDTSGAIAVEAGTDGSTTAFSETRGAAGGPPEIGVGEIEIGQVRVTDDSSAVIATTEIFQTVGTHAERFDYPVWEVNHTGDGDAASVSAKKNAYIEFASEIGDGIHTSGAYKKVYVSGYTPVFTELSRTVDFVPAVNSHTVTSTQVYNGTVGSSTSSLGQASFTAMLNDGITDGIVANQDEIVTFKFYPNRNLSPYSLTQGLLGLSTTFPVADQVQASTTISAEKATANFSS